MTSFRPWFVFAVALTCQSAAGQGTDEGAADQALALAKKTGMPVLAVAGSKT